MLSLKNLIRNVVGIQIDNLDIYDNPYNINNCNNVLRIITTDGEKTITVSPGYIYSFFINC